MDASPRSGVSMRCKGPAIPARHLIPRIPGLGRFVMRSYLRAILIAFSVLPVFAFGATAQIAVSANDNKQTLNNGVGSIPANPPADTVAIIDLGVSPPKLLAEINAPA